MPQQEPPKIEFPCAYPIRVVGDARDDFVDRVYDCVLPHAPDINRDAMRTRDSSKGRFLSVHFVIQAQGVEQLAAIHESLKAYDAVKMVI